MAQQLTESEPIPSTQAEKQITWRTLLLGTLLVVGIDFFMIYTEYAVGSSANNYSHFPIYVFTAFSLLVLFFLPILRKSTKRPILSRSELFLILIMGLVAGAVPSNGLVGFLVVVIATPFYFATPENGWANILHAHIPNFAVPRDAEAMRGFFEGLPPGAAIPWDAWYVPLFWWICFAVALFALCASIATIFNRQWAQHERLPYPLISVAMDLTDKNNSQSPIPDLLKNRGFWTGFGLAVGMLGWNMIGYFSTGFPTIPLGGDTFSIGRGFPTILTKINLFVVGFAYFANLDVLLSIWVFRLLYIFQMGTFNRLGYGTGGNEDQWSSGFAGWQSFGALTAMVLWGLWVARHHLRDVIQKALNPHHHFDDRQEMMSYRTALILLVISSVFCIAWLHKAGMALTMVLVYAAASGILYLGISRIVAESGLLYVRGPISAQVFSLYLIGSGTFGPPTVTAMGLTYTTASQGRGLFMPALTQIARLRDFVGSNRRYVLSAIVLAFVVALITSLATTLYLGYTHGTQNFTTWHIRAGGLWVFNDTAGKILSPFYTDWQRLRFFGLGAILMTLLTFLRYRLPWWPLHPIGFTVSCTYFTQKTFVAVFVAWICKFLILRIGGIALYRRSQPFFLGLLVGYALSVALSAIVDYLWFPGQGHYIHSV